MLAMARKKKSRLKPLSTAEWVLSLFNQIWSIVKDWSTTSWIVAILGTWFAAMVGIYEGLSWWQLYLLSTVILCAFLIGVDRFIAIKTRLKFNPREFEELGERLIEVSDKMKDYMADLRTANTSSNQKATNPQEAHDIWHKNNERNTVINSKFLDRFASDIMYYLDLLEKIGVKTPFHITSTITYRPVIATYYFGYVGKMLSDGFLEDARSIDDQKGFQIATAFLSGD